MPELVDTAFTQARRAADAAGVQVRVLSELTDLSRVQSLYDRIWGRGAEGPLMGMEQLRAMTHAGNYLAGAYVGEELVGACVGFFAAPVGTALHSHVAGVTESVRARSVGFALKLHQRAWSLAQGLSEVTWTYDPLIRRNAYFNLVKLAARPREYLVDFYGDLADAVNAGQGSDRLLVGWDLAAPEVAAACDGRPAAVGAGDAWPALSATPDGRPQPARATDATVLVDVPADVEQLRGSDPGLARQWRSAVRDVLGGLMAGGAQVVGFLPVGGYVVRQWSPRKLARWEESGP